VGQEKKEMGGIAVGRGKETEGERGSEDQIKRNSSKTNPGRKKIIPMENMTRNRRKDGGKGRTEEKEGEEEEEGQGGRRGMEKIRRGRKEEGGGKGKGIFQVT